MEASKIRELRILGVGGHGSVIADIAQEMGYNKIT